MQQSVEVLPLIIIDDNGFSDRHLVLNHRTWISVHWLIVWSMVGDSLSILHCNEHLHCSIMVNLVIISQMTVKTVLNDVLLTVETHQTDVRMLKMLNEFRDPIIMFCTCSSMLAE